MSKSKSTTRTRLRRRAGIAFGAAAVAAMSLTAPAFAEAKLTLTASSGPAKGGNAFIATAPSAIFSMSSPKVLFTTVGAAGTSTCPTTYAVPVAIAANATTGVPSAGIVGVPDANVRKISSTKIAITVPSAALSDVVDNADPGQPLAWEAFNANGLDLVTGQTVAKYNLCVYATRTVNVATNPLLASSSYTIASKPTVTAIDFTSGPALGGTKVTVTGTGFTTGMTASIGGTALTGISVGSGGTTFTATTPPRAAAEKLPITVTATGGTVTSDPNDLTTPVGFSYVNGITATPNTNAGATTATIDVVGVGFSSLDFTTQNTDTLDAFAHVFLVAGKYNPIDDTNGDRTTPPATECTNVLVIGDQELICDIDTAKVVDPADGALKAGTLDEGAYVVTVVSSGEVDADDDADYFQSRVTSGSIFTVAAY